MTQAIETRFMPVTNSRPSRVKAFAPQGSVILSYDHSLNVNDMHARAAMALADQLGWLGTWLQGSNVKGDGYVFVKLIEINQVTTGKVEQ